MWLKQRAERLHILQKGYGVLERNLEIKADGKNWANILATSITRLKSVRGFFPPSGVSLNGMYQKGKL
jgi:hypothetical protein